MKKNDFHRLHVSLLIIFVCLLKGHQGFFIKHSVSGLCLKVEDNYFAGSPSNTWGYNYYVKFYDGCLHSHAQYRYVSEKFVHNIKKDGTFFGRRYKSGETDRYNNRFIVYRNKSTTTFVRKPEFALRHKSGTLKIYDGQYCATPSRTTKPFNGAYPVKTTTCDQELQKFTFGSVTDKDAIMTDVNCASSQVMEVVMAEYGAFRNGGTFKSSTDTACSLPVGCIVKGLCDGKTLCGITVGNRFTFNQCAGSKRLHMEYQCVDSLGSPITSVSDVRLSKEALLNEGFIEVFHGTTWRNLSDENWDKRKQTALCRHLGYIDGENDTVVKNISPGEMILSGDLYCQGTKPSNQSCCAYLYPSTSTGASNMAYAKCKICDDPLLQNSTRFPDGIFSVNAGNAGHEARLSNNGWCSTSSPSSYLQIDLKRDFFISYIANFGDKTRTKWLESYELKYSSTASDLDSKTGITITANHDAYRASITKLDTVHARYLKIIPKSGNDFCLRVEICGQILLPDPVSNVVVSKPTSSALVSWSLPQIEGHGSVTYFLIFLNGKQKENVTRDRNQYTFNNLKLYTSYTVTIEAGNAYGVGESVSKTFARDDPGFFIKHSESGLCVRPQQSPFTDESWGSIYYVEFHDGCLDPDAQFRFVDKEYVQNIAKDGTLIARNQASYFDRFLVYEALVAGNKKFVRESRFRLNQTMSGSLSMYSGSYCATPDGSTTPKEGTYLKRTTTCDTDIQKFTFGSVTSHGATMVDVGCATTQKMEVVMAEYGAFSNGKTFDKDNDIDCSLPAACIVKNQCKNKSSCAITVNSSLFTFNQCPGTKQLHMEYQCVDNLGTPITSVSDVRLSTDQNEGFVEVFDGTTWKKLSDESWDKRKQASLCRHLGYIDVENDTVVKNITSGEMILSGDLYCQHRNQSCCAYLYPSASTARSNMAYAKCTCDDPLLQNSTRFPNSVFSANAGNTGHEARLSNNGWCPTSSSSSYLQIDLKRDFYISYIATFGDKARTKWLESYELKYSSTASDLDSKTGKTITANHDAYRASSTRLDFLYARYLKIIPKSGKDFCLRVELCGQVLLPDPVSNVVVNKPTRTTADVSWSVPQIEGRGGVTYFLVSLNGNGQYIAHNISRNGDSSQYTFNNLNLYASYTVTIEAGNAYGVGENVSVLFSTDEPGFFIKHSGTGLCIKPTNGHFDTGSWGQQYYVEFYDDCLHSDAQFRYVDKEFVVNIGKDGTLIGRVKKRYEYRFLVYHPGTQGTKDFLRKREHTLKQTTSGSLITYQGTQCAIPKTLTTPSQGDQLIRTASCGTELQKFTFGSVTSLGATMVDVSCATTQKMVVVMAEYGVFRNGGTFKSSTDADCSLPVACKVVKGLCDGKISCGITVNSSLFPFNQCAGTKRLHMEYRCVDNLGTRIASVRKVRLSHQADQGFVEVFNGTTWRKVNDENWDKRKQNSLCHHLGLSNESYVADIRKIGVVEDLASGALYCRGIKPSDQSCCAYLYSSKSTVKSRIPYVKCKICNESLLQNSTRFPKIVLSASVANANDARLTNNGWCSTSSATPWLKINLQKDYYISHIATVGDKDQTKRVTSYSLQYSRTESELGSNGRERTIKANDDTYRASITKIDIVYARYLKLTTIKGNDFCIRVELCGHVLLPDPVQNVVVDTITARSARVSWSVPQYEGHSGVTYFLIFLNGTKKDNVTRKDNNNQCTLNDLKPYRNCKVTIKAGNVYGVGESFSKTFKTNQAAPDGPPLNVVVVSQSTSSLRVTWSPPDKNVSNGIITRYKICHSTFGVEESCISDISPTSHDINNLQAATKYILRISAGTSVGYGTWTPNITKITNQEPVTPTMKTYFSLEITLEKPRADIRSLLIVVQAANSSSTITDDYQSNELQPYINSSVPYVTAGLSVSGLPKNFTIGVNYVNQPLNVNYVNQPLKQDTNYIVFLRFIATEKIYYSTDWSTKVKTFRRPQAPLKLKAFTLSSSSLNISWEQPKLQENVQILAYSVCYKGQEKPCNSTERTTYLFNYLKQGTEYEVRVCSVTTAGNSTFNTISKFTNEAPLVTQDTLNHNFKIVLPRKPQTFSYLQVIVQAANIPQRPPDQYLSKDLKSYHDRISTSDPYITAQLKSSEAPLSTIFTVGDGKWYNSTNSSYYNKPLEQEQFYIVFARYFENETKYYSSYWSKAIKTILIPAPQIINIDSYGNNSLNISWEQPDLPAGQTANNYIITYRKSKNVQKVTTESISLFYILKDLEYETKYFFQVQIQTQDGKSAPSSEMSKRTNAEPLAKPKKEGKRYTVTLRKPKKGEKVENVKLIVLQLQSESTIPTPPERIKLVKFSNVKKSDDNVAFVVSELSMAEFTDATHDVILQVSDAKRRRKRSPSVVKGLRTGLTYITSQGNYDQSGAAITVTSWSPGISFAEGDIKTPSGTKASGGGGLTGAVVGIVVAVLLILLAVVGFVFWRRRSNNRYSDTKAVYDKGNEEIGGLENGVDRNDGEGEASMGDMSDEGIYSNETGFTLKQKRPPVPISAFAHYVNEMKANEDLAFTTEYEELPTTSDVSWEVAKRPYNKKKNRYGNIVTYDHCRVTLSGDEDSDYINASFIDGVEPNSYIACQGPNKYSLDDMWRMVWEQRTYSIVMVTSLIELGKPKCDKYWPDQGSEKYGDIEVTLVKTEEFACHETRTFQIKKDDEEREVKHYYYSSWPDHGVPKYPTQLLAFRRHFRTHHLKQSGPIIVHCSAGVGRTGVFLAIDSTLEKIEKGLIESIDIFGQVSEMRTRRMNMIQTMEQYKFVHEAILETILCGMNEVDSNNIKKEIKKQSDVQAGGMTGFQEKFKRLGEVSPIFTEEECTAGLLEGNQSKNRSKNIYPAESSRVNIRYIDSEENSDYINAVFVHGYLGRNYFIATQTPLPSTVNDFWRMVHEQKSSAIVLLNNVKDGTSFPKFWSSTRAQPKQYGDLTIQLESATEKNGIFTRKFMLSAYPDLQDAHVVKIFHYTKWHDHRIPETADGVITLTSLVEKSRHSSEEGPVIVVCSDGAGRSGSYIAISNLIERMKIEQVVDVFQSIKIIRASRPQFVENADQYQFCYSAVSSYLDAFSEYANFE